MGRKKSRDGLLKDGTSRLAKTGGRRNMPPIMWVAVIACAVGAYFLFRQPGGAPSGGIGERRSVVTVASDTAGATAAEAPRSGDVDIAGETRDLTPEPPEQAAAATPPVETKPEPEPAPPPTPKPAPAQPAPEVARIVPVDRGPWVVQIGSFGQVSNADAEAARLRELGFDARVKMGNLSDGTIAYRVRIGYFASRDEAEAFARQEKKSVPGAIAVHR